MNKALINEIKDLGKFISVLYVEDDLLLQEKVYKFLSKIYTNVDTVANGQEAFVLYSQKNYNLVITDLAMPSMDGISFIKAMYARKKDQAVIVLSAHNDQDKLMALIDTGISNFVLKPINMNIFLDVLLKESKAIYTEKMLRAHYHDLEEMCYYLQEDGETNEKDILTQLPNIHALHKQVQKNDTKSLILIEINDYALLNVKHNYILSNEILLEFTELLQPFAKEHHFSLYKVRHDQFALFRFSDDQKEDQKLERFVNILLEDIHNHPFGSRIQDEIYINTTISYLSSHENIFEDAVLAMAYAKKHHLPCICNKTYNTFTQDIIEQQQCRKTLRQAIKDKRIIPYYQGITDREGNLIKYEVLMRLINNNEDETVILPSEFLTIAKEEQYYTKLSELVFFQALKEMRQHTQKFSFNLAYDDFTNLAFLDKIEKYIVKHKLASQIIFEIVESDVIKKNLPLDHFIKRFRELGCEIAIDDFGSGYCNFSYILMIQPEYLKIDGSLIQELMSDKRAATVIQSVIDLAHTLNITVIAEYVSSEEIYMRLKSMGVDNFQGFYFYEPTETLANV